MPIVITPPSTPYTSPVNAASTDTKVAAVAGSSLASVPAAPTLAPPAGGGIGVFGLSGSAQGVYGTSVSDRGVYGSSQSNSGVYGTSQSFDAVVGETNSDAHAGVTGRNLTTGANGGVGIYGTGGQYAGKFDGNLQVNGDATVTGNHQVNGNATVTGNHQVDGNATVTGNHQVNGNATITGTAYVTTDVILGAAAGDCAEEFDVSVPYDVEPGTVTVLDDSGSLCPSGQAYDRRVAGVVSGAGEYRPGMILDRRDSSGQRVPIALAGKVYCKVDARYGPIAVGDLLTTSPTPGCAMRAKDPEKAFGAVIGKALRPLGSGQDLIPILVALQ